MTTKRKRTKATARAGIKYVRDLVESYNCIFQEIDLENDIGNDAYIEFIQEEDSTGCCIAVQIKTGSSYVSKTDKEFILRADKEHFEYWNSHILPIGAIVFDPQSSKAAWCDITDYLSRNPSVVKNGPFNVKIPAEREFNSTTFNEFKNNFLVYREQYRKDGHFGKSLEEFASRDDLERCNNGLRSLFYFHRQRYASWYFLVNSLRTFRNHPLLRTLVHILCHIPGHGDIYWHKGNIMNESVRRAATSLMTEQFDKTDVITLLESVDEYGYERGRIGQCVHAIIDIVNKRDEVLKSIAFDESVDGEVRFSALTLFLYYEQRTSSADCISYVNKYLKNFPDTEHELLLQQLLLMLREYGCFTFY
ncbi:MAG: DUF4365 domain-containing protein [Pyrinomonadaceae bacterium]